MYVNECVHDLMCSRAYMIVITNVYLHGSAPERLIT